MKGYPRPSPYEIGEADPKVPYAPEEDVGETETYCDACREETRWILTQVNVAQAEAQSAMPSVYHALEGETGWVCTECGNFRRNLIADEGYDWQYSNVGYTVDSFPDDEETVREAASGGVSPPERIHDYGGADTPEEWAAEEVETEQTGRPPEMEPPTRHTRTRKQE